MEIDGNTYFFYFLLCTYFSFTLILSASELGTQQLMTSHIWSHIKYLIQAYNITVLILYSKFMTNRAKMTVFNTIYDDTWLWLTF